MPSEQLRIEVITERPVVRTDQISDIDVAIDLVTSKSVGTQTTSYAINLCVVIDRSGSMGSDNKLEQAKKSCVDIYENLNPNDKFSVLAFDNEVVSVVNPQTPRNQVKDRILALYPGGNTDLSKGWYLGLLELQTYAADEHINRLVLLSDGMANAGEQKPTVLGAESSRARDELAITTSTIGIGTGFQEDILAALAHESGGRFWFIGEARIEDIIKEEFSGALSVILERPGVELRLPPGVMVIRELNDLPKTSDRYRIRPIKANDRFCFALRLRADPAKIVGDRFPIGATLLDGAGVVEKSETFLSLGSVEEYVQSPEDPRVAMIVRKYLEATSDEKIIEQLDEGNVTTMLKMLQSQSDLMKDLEAKLAGAKAVSWEEMGEREREEQERRRKEQERHLAHLRMEIAENEALFAVSQLVDVMQGLGQTDRALSMLAHARKMHQHRGNRNLDWGERGEMDDWAAGLLCNRAIDVVDSLMSDYPSMRAELADIRERINEELAKFS